MKEWWRTLGLMLAKAKGDERSGQSARYDRLARLLVRHGESSRELLPPPSPNRKTYPFIASLIFQGIPIDLEQRKGDTREGVDPDGTPWKVTMRAHYGEVRSHVRGASGVMGARGQDGDRLDVYVGDDLESDVVVVVDQRIPETGEHDEQKVMLGFSTVEEALDCYRGQYTKPGFYGGHTVMTVDEFRRRIADPKSAGQRLSKALDGVEWVPLSTLLGELAFASAIAKGQTRHETPDGAEVIAWHVLTKAGQRTVKYIKRWKVGGKWRYAYARTNAAGRRTVAEHHIDTAHMGEGSSWQLHDGHYTVTAEHGDEVTITRDGGKTSERLSKDELRRRVLEHHREAIEAHREQSRQELEDVRQHGSERQKAALGSYGFPVYLAKDDRGRTLNQHDRGVLEALHSAKTVKDVEAALRGVEHREFSVSWEDGKITEVRGGLAIEIPNVPNGEVIAFMTGEDATGFTRPDRKAHVINIHNHPHGEPPSGPDAAAAFIEGVEGIRVVVPGGTWHLTAISGSAAQDVYETAELVQDAGERAMAEVAQRWKADGRLIQRGRAYTVPESDLEAWHEEVIEEYRGQWQAGGSQRSAVGVQFVPIARPAAESDPSVQRGAQQGALREGHDRSRGASNGSGASGASSGVTKGDLQAVGDHIWGSRKDLASLGRIESSKQLEGMSYADAAAVVTKAKLVTPLDLEDARALGMEPAVAHLFMHMLSTVRAKPDDTAASRAAFVDEVREIQGAMRRVKTFEDFKALRAEMISKWRSAPQWVRSPYAASTEYPMFSDAARAEAKRLTQETGIEHRVQGDYSTYRSRLVVANQRPYESLGTRFVNTLTESTPGARRDLRAAFIRAQELVDMGNEAAWDVLRTGSVTRELPKTKGPTKPKPNTDRGHSTAKSESAEVVRVGGRPVADANPARVRSTFNLREVDFGQAGYMTQADREHHVKQLEGALHDLVDVLGLPPAQVSFHGRLGVALGARGRGKAAAHYEPGRAAINITKFAGGGALAHEWGHALDNIIAGHYLESTIGSAKGDTFLTKTPAHAALPTGLRAAASTVVHAMSKVPPELLANLKTVSRRMEEAQKALSEARQARLRVGPGRESDALIEHLQSVYVQARDEYRAVVSTMPRQKQIDELDKAIEQAQGEAVGLARSGGGPDLEGVRGRLNALAARRSALGRLPEDASQYAVDAAMLDNRGRRYWSTPEEMFARAFESYVHDKLAEMGRKNTYLTDQRGAGAGWYPQGEERRRINREMDFLFAHLRTSGDLEKAMNRMLNTSSPEPLMSASAAFWALIKAAYKRKVPTGRFRTKKDGSQGAEIFRHIYTDEAAVQRANQGEHINLHRHGGGVHEVLHADDEGVTLRHAKTGVEKRMTHDELQAAMANAYRKSFDRGAEALVRRYVAAASRIKADPSDAQAMHAELAERFKKAGVDAEHAKRLVGFLAQREGWHTDAKKALLAIASDPRAGKVIAPRGRQIARAAENLARTEKAKEVGANHVGQAVVLRTPEGGFDAHLADLRQRVAVELAHTEALLGAVEAAGDNAAMKRAMVDHATQAMRGRAAQELDHLVDAYPGLRDVPEVERLRVARAKFQALQAEREGERKAEAGGFVGASTIVYVADAEGNPTPQQARYRLIDASRVIASHDPIAGFQQRKDYPDGVQERSYHRDKAEQEKVRRNAQGLKPAYVVNTNPDAVNGPPVMTSEGIVLGGNSRTMSMQLAYEQHPEAAERLKAHLRDNAHAFGFAKGDVDALERPILVREVELEDKGKANLGVLVRRYNESFTQGMDPRVDQVARGRMVTQGMLDSISAGMGRTNDSGDPLYPTLNAFLGSSDGMRFVSELSSASEGKAIIDRRNRSMYVGKDGKLNEDGKTFVERVLVGHVLPDPDLLGDMLPKHVSAIAAVVPHVVGAASKGHDVKEPLKTALNAYAYMRRKGLANVDEFERDSGGFASLGIEGFEQKPKLDALSKPLLNVIASRIDKPTQLASFFREFATQARRNPAGQASLLGDTIDTASLLQGSDGRTVAGQRDMFKGNAMWVELDERFGERIWSSVIAKGGHVQQYGEAEVMPLPWWIVARLDPSSLMKHRGGIKYVKRVPTGKYRTTKSGKQGAPIYRYYYKAEHGGGMGRHADMVEGASFRHGTGELKIHAVKDGKLVVSHSSSPNSKQLMTHAELAKKLDEYHGGALAMHREKLQQELKEARQYGSKKHVDRILDEMRRKGFEPATENWEEFKPRPKGVPVDFTGHPLASELAKVPADHFVAYTIKKIGREVAKKDEEGKAIKGEKIRVGNAKVLSHMVTGFDYGQLVADSQTVLDKLTVDAMVEKLQGKQGWGGKDKGWVPVTREHVEEALAKVRESVAKSLAGEHNKESGRRPLVVNGQRVPGLSVYRGDESAYTGPESATPSPASIYVAGVQVHSVELEPGDNPEPETQSSPVTVARKVIESLLPHTHYRSYRLDPDEDWSLRVGQNLVITRENLQELYKAAFMRRKPFIESDFVTFAEEGWNPEDPSSHAGTISGEIDMSYLGIGDDSLASIQKALVAAGWVPMDEALGERIWNASLAKAHMNDDVRAVPWWLALRLGGSLTELMKARYVKRVPTGKYRTTKSGGQGAPIYRYFYGAHEGGGVHAQEDMREGASFKHGDGHYHVRGEKDGKLHVVHSKTGQEEHLTHAELAARLKDHHREDLERHRARLHDELAEAKSSGLSDDDPRVQKIVEEHKKAGHKTEPLSEMQRLAEPKKYEAAKRERDGARSKKQPGATTEAAKPMGADGDKGNSPKIGRQTEVHKPMTQEEAERIKASVGKAWADKEASTTSKPAPKPASTSEPAASVSHEDRVSEAKRRYGLQGAELTRLDAHEHTKKAAELHAAGDHDKAARYIREAVKEVLYKTPERNMSPSSAERYMRARDSLRIMKALLLGARSTNSQAA